jgi:bacteriocin biosynthesis cyclodehydratase domain-containing protein
MPGPTAELVRPTARPRLKPWYRLATIEDRVVLRYGGSVLEFGGGAARALLPRLLGLLDGSRTVAQIVSELGEPARPAVEHALSVLAERSLLAEPLDSSLRPEVARTAEFLCSSDPFGREMTTVASTLSRSRIAVVGMSGVAEVLVGLLGPIVETTWVDWGNPAAHGFNLVIVAPAPDEFGELGPWNRTALDQGTEWLQVLPFDGQLAAVGPIVVPSETACHECFSLRRSSCISPVIDTATGSYPEAPPADALLASYAALVALRRVGLADGASVGVLLAVEHGPTLTATRHVVHRVPRCPACSSATARAIPSPWNEVHGIAA